MNEVLERPGAAQSCSRRPLFELGVVVATRRVWELAAQGVADPIGLLYRHSMGDWGDLCDQDKELNDACLKSGNRRGRLHSAYQITPSLTVWVITEFITEYGGSVTTLLLPSEY